MMSKLKKKAEKLLKAIEFEPAILSTNRGTRIKDDCIKKPNSKKRRHRGWITAKWAGKGKYKEVILEGLDATYYYDDWQDARDGQRDMWNNDKIYKVKFNRSYWRYEAYDNIKQLNAKLKKHECVRRAMKAKEKIKNEK